MLHQNLNADANLELVVELLYSVKLGQSMRVKDDHGLLHFPFFMAACLSRVSQAVW